MNETMHIAFGFDKNCVMPCGVAMLSICMNTPGPILFHAVLDDDVTDESRKILEDIALSHGNRMLFYKADTSAFQEYSGLPYITRSTLLRLILPDLIPADVTKILYLDTDILAVGSLEPLWNMELGLEEPAAMVVDSAGSSVIFHNPIDIPLSQPYYNAGVMLMNLECWRKESIGTECIRELSEKNYRCADQDVINKVIGHRVKPAHLRFNLQITFIKYPEANWYVEKEKYFSEVREAKENPAIIHYIGEGKPWHYGNVNNAEWLKYKALSPWKNEPLPHHFTRSKNVLYFDMVNDSDIRDINAVAQPLIALTMLLAREHRKMFIFLRKGLWTIAKKKRLTENV